MSKSSRINILSRCSFRQLLLVAFLTIAGLLAATSVHALFTLEQLSSHSRDSSRQTVHLTEQLQHIAERTVAMERATRQFLVLDDPIFRVRYQEAAGQARATLDELATGLPATAAPLVAAWRDNEAALRQVLEQGAGQRAGAADNVSRILAQLPALNQQLGNQIDAQVAARNDLLLYELEQQRAALGWQVFGAIVLAVLLACVFGLWLAMPLAHLEAAIGLLGSGRFDIPLAVRGPSDLRGLGRQLEWLRQRLANGQTEKTRLIGNLSRRLRKGADNADPSEAAAVLSYYEAVLEAQQLHRMLVDVGLLLHKVIDDYRSQCESHDVRVEVSGQAAPLSLDLGKIELVLRCLLSNALQFSPHGGVIFFILAQHGVEGLRLDCIDQGPGFAPEDAPYLFDPFHVFRNPMPAPAVIPAPVVSPAINLAIAREYIEVHHGSIALLPAANGAHFCIILPDEN